MTVSGSGPTARLTFEGTNSLIDRLAPASWVTFRARTNSGTLSPIIHAIITRVQSSVQTIDVHITGYSGKGWTSAASYVGPGYADTYGGLYGSPKEPSSASGVYTADLYLYDVDFDSLSDEDKSQAMRHILDTLPPILDIKNFLISHPHTSLRSMEQISPAAASCSSGLSPRTDHVFSRSTVRRPELRLLSPTEGTEGGLSRPALWEQVAAAQPDPQQDGEDRVGRSSHRGEERIQVWMDGFSSGLLKARLIRRDVLRKRCRDCVSQGTHRISDNFCLAWKQPSELAQHRADRSRFQRYQSRPRLRKWSLLQL